MEDADLLLIFKMFAIDFLFIKNEKKIYVLQKGNIMIIDFFLLGIGLLSLLT